MREGGCAQGEAPGQQTLDVAAGWNKPAELKAAQTVEKLRKLEGGTSSRLGADAELDVFGDAAKREETLAGRARAERLWAGVEMKELQGGEATRENEAGLATSGRSASGEVRRMETGGGPSSGKTQCAAQRLAHRLPSATQPRERRGAMLVTEWHLHFGFLSCERENRTPRATVDRQAYLLPEAPRGAVADHRRCWWNTWAIDANSGGYGSNARVS